MSELRTAAAAVEVLIIINSGSMNNSNMTPPAMMQQPTGTLQRAAMERDVKKQKEKFIILVRVLMKYLEHKDPPLLLKVKATIKDCAERNRDKEPGYESVTGTF